MKRIIELNKEMEDQKAINEAIKKETRIWQSLSLGKTQSWKFVKVFVICPNCNKMYLSKWTHAFVQNSPSP